MSASSSPDADAVTRDLLDYLGAAPTPFHAVHESIDRLQRTGFRRLDERADWGDVGPGRYFVEQGGSALIAFCLPRAQATEGFRIVGAHTDSPNLRLKPKAPYAREGWAQLGVEVYGGALLNSWLDRDLSIAGRLFVRDDAGAVTPRLVRMSGVVARVPQLAIHLDREVNEKGLVLNRQEHLAPVIGLGTSTEDELLALVANDAKLDRARVVGAELMLFDVVAPTRAGRSNELIFSGRLDNLAMCHAATLAIVEASKDDDTPLVPVAVLFDHEEVGSASVGGAGSALLPRVLERSALARRLDRAGFLRVLAGSLCASADMAHAVHPNYPDRHESRHRPVINGGPVIKFNAQQRYATSAETAAIFESLCRAAEVPVQKYVNRTDLPCGSTIGPITSTLLGVRTVDVGNAMLSMHSIRELAGSDDPARMTEVLRRFLAHVER
ncbi:MAG: M18 family aminopeptidase [Polyangiales bacterium]